MGAVMRTLDSDSRLQEDIRPEKRKRSKPVVLECRYTSETWDRLLPGMRFGNNEWRRWGTYETEKDAMQAAATVAGNHQRNPYSGMKWEFRVRLR